ncbi:MAG: Uma2 family endonuclease [Sporichthyaceae bacterium]
MAATTLAHRWTLQQYLLAWEAGAFANGRTELVDGEVWAVSIGRGHGRTATRVIRALPNDSYEITSMSLASGESLPDPDCWVLRANAEPLAQLSPRMPRWSAADVLLVVEVADETLDQDLGVKAVLYGLAGYAHYWAVTKAGIYAHSDPGPQGYRSRRLIERGELITVPYEPDVTLSVTDLIGDSEG